ncbi:hypothetical protein V2W45_1465550 [Cenococcum geophilum]
MNELAENWMLYPYTVDDLSPPSELQIPQNKGHEVMDSDIVPLIHSLRLSALNAAGYILLRCDWYSSCPAEIRLIIYNAVQWGPGVYREDAENGIAEVWHILFPRVELPRTIASQCCRREKADYERIRDWILNITLIDDVSGRVLEKLWAYIMTNDTIHCPLLQECVCEYFRQCEPRDWPAPPKGLAKWPSE